MKLGGYVPYLMDGVVVAATPTKRQSGINRVCWCLICPALPEQSASGSGNRGEVSLFAFIRNVAGLDRVVSKLGK